MHARAQSWVSTGPFSKSVRVVVQSPVSPSVFYAGAFGWGVYKSIDGGLTWTSQKSGLVNTYVRSLVALTDDIILAGTNDGIFASTNGGSTWTLSLGTLNSVRSMAYDASMATIYAATYGQGMYKSTNQGASWSSITVTDPVSGQTLLRQRAIAVFGADSLYVGGAISDIDSGGALFKSVNGGTSWIQVQRNVGIRSSVMSIAVNPASKATWLIIGTAARGVYRSRNAGTNWVSLNGPGLPNPLADSSINCVAMTSSMCFAGSDSLGRLYYRDVNDTLVGWLVATGTPGLSLNNIWIHGSTPSTLFLATEGQGIYRSATSGASWISSNTGMLGIDVRDLHVDGAGKLLLATGFGDGIWTSSNQAGSWTRAETLGTSNSITSIAPTSTPGLLYASAYGTGVYKSTNGGASWYITDSTVINHFVRPIVVHPSNANIVYAGTGNGVYKTTNGGANWFTSGPGIPSGTSIRSLELDPRTPSMLFAGTDSNYLYKSTNDGASWTNITSGFLPQDIFIRTITVDTAVSQLMFVGADSGRIYRSVDGGSGWSLLVQLPTVKSVRRILVHPSVHTTLFAATFGSGLFVSVNGGLNWATLNNGLTDLELNSIASIGPGPLTLFGGTANAGVFRVTYTGVNDPPILSSIGNRSVIPGNTLNVGVRASDPQGTIPSLTVANAPPGATFVDSANGNGLFVWTPQISDIGVSMVTFRASDGVLVDSEIVAIQVLDPSQVAVDVAIEQGWNLVSVPVVAASMSVAALFPTANSTAYQYQSGYVGRDQLAVGDGYWLKFPEAQIVQMGGSPIVRDTIDVPVRWSIIGSLSYPIPVNRVTAVPPMSILSPFFGFSPGAGYIAADTLLPGHGYWMKSDQSGQIALDTSGVLARPVVTTIAGVPVPVLKIRDSRGIVRVLRAPAVSANAELVIPDYPPPPPDGILDVRWSKRGITDAMSVVLDIRSADYPLYCAWENAGAANNLLVTLQGPQNGRALSSIGTGEFVISRGEELVVSRLTGEMGVQTRPSHFSLDQNYPNPFNPSTSIRYTLTIPGHARVRIFNALGQYVTHVADQLQEAGAHTVHWDGSSYPSGLYYYLLEVTDPSSHLPVFRSSRTMMLIK